MPRAGAGTTIVPAEWRDDAWHKPAFIFFLLVWLANVIVAAFGIRLPEEGMWVEGLLPVAAVATTLVGLRRVLPWQNLLAMAIIVGGFGFAVTLLSLRTSFPFGPLVFLDPDSNPMFNVVPWWVPALWVVLVLNARAVARVVLFRWRTGRNYGLWVIGLACLLVAAFDLGLEPYATQVKRYWAWTSNKSAVDWHWLGTPVTSFLGWAICTLVVAIATVVWGINKRPLPVAPHYHPLALWVLLNGLTAVGNIGLGLWLPAGCSIGITAAVVAVAVWPARGTPVNLRIPGSPSSAVPVRRTRD